MDKLTMHTPDRVDENILKIGNLFPNCITETLDEAGKPVKAIDFDMLKQELSKVVVDGPKERYQFTWPDKKKAMLLANSPISATLRPCLAESSGKDGTPGKFDSENLYIEGDNLDVLKLLQETYLGKVKMIYIDPPYNKNKDFIYEDNFDIDTNSYKELSGDYDDQGNRLRRNNDSNGRFHTDWLNMMYPRIKIARDLLADDGLIFLSIDDKEVDNLRKICDELFGQRCFLSIFPRITKRGGKSSDIIASNHDYLLAYSKTETPLLFPVEHNDKDFKYKDEYFESRGFYKLNQTLDYDSLQYSKSLDYPIEIDGEVLYPGSSYEDYLERKKGNHNKADWAWRWSEKLYSFGLENGFIVLKRSKKNVRLYTKTYQRATIEEKYSEYFIDYSERTKSLSTLELTENEYSNDNATKDLQSVLGNKKLFDYSKPVSLLTLVECLCTQEEDIILDFFSGSATTAHAVMQLNAEDGGNRKFIMVQIPENTDETSEAYKAGYKNICEIGKERIRRAGKKVKEEAGLNGQNLDIGFRVLKIDSSNMKDVYYSPEKYVNDPSLFDSLHDNIKEDRSGEDLLFQVMLDLGIELSANIKEQIIDGRKIYNVKDGYLIVCFESGITDKVITELAKQKPFYAVFRDSSFKDDAVAANFEQIFATFSPETVKKVL